MESATDTRAPTPSPADVPQLYEQLLAEYVSAMKVTGDEFGLKDLLAAFSGDVSNPSIREACSIVLPTLHGLDKATLSALIEWSRIPTLHIERLYMLRRVTSLTTAVIGVLGVTKLVATPVSIPLNGGVIAMAVGARSCVVPGFHLERQVSTASRTLGPALDRTGV